MRTHCAFFLLLVAIGCSQKTYDRDQDPAGKMDHPRPQSAARTVSELVADLQSPEAEVRFAATEALSSRGAEAQEAIPALIVALSDPSPVPVRGGAMDALSRIGPAAVPALVAALRGDNKWTREGAAIALGDIGAAAKDGVEALQACRDDEELVVVQAAQEALKKIR